MMILRRARYKTERAYINDKSTSEEKSSALFILRGCVKITRHPYQRNSHSPAGNCWCGRDQSHGLHRVVIENE